MAYASLLSLIHTLEQTLHQDFQYLILDEKQKIASLLEKVSFLQDFLDNFLQKSSDVLEHVEGRIRDAAYKIEDIIESHIAHQVLEESPSHRGKIGFCLSTLEKTLCSNSQETSLTTFSHELQKVIEELDSIKRQVEKIEHETNLQDLQPGAWTPAGSSKPASSGKSNTVGLDDDMMEIKDRLTGGSSNLETVSIVGMGGIGKTTFARKLYDDELIVYYFYIRPWVTVSQDYNVPEIYLGLLDSMNKLTDQMSKESTENLAEFLYKNLKGRRYLMVLDDVWDTKVWDEVKRLFPNDNNGSRIMMTTRLENVAGYENSCAPHHMRFLNEDQSWNLLCEIVFGKVSCPHELEQTGKSIAQNCRGLPLAIVVIAGLLSKASKTQHYWTNVGENLSSLIASNDEQCSRILSLSYRHLPHHLKGCFLYMGSFPEDFNIRVSNLVRLWVSEGLLKSVKSKSLENVAEEYLLDLVDRNLILASEQSSKGKIKTFRIHDLLRDLCVREAEREKFFCVTNSHLDDIQRHLSIQSHKMRDHHANKISTSVVRSFLNFDICFSVNLKQFRLLRVLDDEFKGLNEKAELVNLRYLSCSCLERKLPASVYKYRNLQTLSLHRTLEYIDLELEIWKMPHLRHVKLKGGYLPNPPSAEIEGGNSIIILENLRTLSGIESFRFTEEILQRVPNLKKLGICYAHEPMDLEYYCLNNAGRLHKLESLNCFFLASPPSSSFLHNITFPTTLKKLTLDGCRLPWEDMTIVGSLPTLQVLKLKYKAFDG